MKSLLEEKNPALDGVLAELRSEGFRLTPQRVAIIKLLVSHEHHYNAEQLYEIIQQDFPTTSRATIYKTLLALKNTGKLMELTLPSAPSKYDYKNSMPHAHLVCTICQSVWDAEIPLDEDHARRVASQYGFINVTQRLDFFGICPDCQTLVR